MKEYKLTDYKVTAKQQVRCPLCLEMYESFIIKDELTLACRQCGCNFTPKTVLKEIDTGITPGTCYLDCNARSIPDGG